MLKKNYIHFLLVLLAAIVFASMPSCKKDPQPEPYFGYDYFPINKGHWVVYDVDSIDFNAFTGKVDTFQYQVKEVIGDAMAPEGGENKTYSSVLMERYSRPSGNEPWSLNWVGFVNLHKERLEKVENNQKIVKLIFPIRRNLTWKGNAFNNLEEWDFKYLEAHEAMNIEGNRFDSTVTVLQVEDFNLIEEKKYKEIYARNIGLVSKEIIDVKTDVDGTIKSGFKFYQKINTYGE